MARETFPLNIRADTLWFQNKLNLSEFMAYADKRKVQGFNAVQMCVGVPPEVGPSHPNAKVDLAETAFKIDYLNKLGMLAIAYGAWGHQIEWFGVDGMKERWAEIVSVLDNKNVVYCLTGESNLWVGQEMMLFPDKCTDDITFHYPNIFNRFLHPIKLRQRKEKWSQVLEYLHGITNKPIIIHVLSGEYSYQAVNNPELFSAVTIQSGHSKKTKHELMQLINKGKLAYPNLPILDLEPAYQGITHGKFGIDYQYFQYETIVKAGADGYCYGAQGVWNVNKKDGFLSHWGKQTYQEGLDLPLPWNK
jgi:hypothetical protein